MEAIRGTNRRTCQALVAILSLLLSLCWALPARADEANDAPVRVGYYENEIFEEGAGEGRPKTGYAYEYYRKLSEYTGWRYDYVYGDFTDLYQMLQDGTIDLLAGLAYREERTQVLSYPEAKMGSESYYLVKQDSLTDIGADPSTLAGHRIGVLDSAMLGLLETYLKDHDVTAEVIAYPSNDQLFEAFDTGAVEVFVAESNGSAARDHAEVICAFGSSDYYLCVAKSRPDLLEELNDAQAQLAVDQPNYINSLAAKYYSRSVNARAFTADERAWIASHDELKVGYLDDYLPYSDQQPDGQPTGLVTDVVPAMLQGLGLDGIRVTFVGYGSYDEMVEALVAGDVDTAFPVGGGLYNSEESGIYLSDPVSAATSDIVYRGTFDDGTLSRIAVNERNGLQGYFVKTYYPDAEVVTFSTVDDCLRAVIDGRATCTVLNGLRANDLLRNREYRVLSLRQTNRFDNHCLGVEIGNKGLLKLMNRGVNVISPDVTQNLSNRYAASLYSYTLIDVIADHMALFGTLVLTVAAIVTILVMRDSRRTRKEAERKELARAELEDKNRELAESKDALSRALEAARQANRAKTTFLNNMSHDIRTPMNAIVGFTALAAAHVTEADLVSDYLDKIAISSQHLLSLINDVLDMSRIESGKVTIEEAEAHLPDIIHDLATIIQPNVQSKQLDLAIDTLDVVHEDVICDRLRLNQVLLNILSNAIKFTPAGGAISFRVIERASSLSSHAVFEFRIKDNGIGMSEEFQQTIFEAFTRERSSTVSGIEGTGLGMSISKNIVDMMGGTITVSSQEGVGSEFVVTLPLYIIETQMEFEDIPELRRMRALVADDDVDTCLSVCSMLREIGLRPDWASSGREAVVRAREATESRDAFGIYILDWRMPDLNGIECARQIRRIAGDDAPIIVLTAYDWADIEREAREAGVTAFATKPLFLSELRKVLAEPFRTNPVPVADTSDEPDLVGRRILIAEDNELNQMIATEILSEHGLVIEVASDGVEALEMVEAVPAGYYDAVLMDVQMPRMDGLEAARRIRALDDRAKASVPIVAVTANAFEEDKKSALDAGMNGHLAKPYDIDEILATLASLIA